MLFQSKKKGLSFEEKRNRMMELFFERKEFFHLKELEKIAPKSKGISKSLQVHAVNSMYFD